MSRPIRLILALLAVFVFRVAFAGFIHGPLFLHHLVYRHHGGLMTTEFHLPALLGGELVVTLILAGLYLYHFSGRPSFRSALLFGFFLGIAIYLPQNLFNWILIEGFPGSVFWSWFLSGWVGSILSVLLFHAVHRH
jgi:hypothetical protein